jgi:hypothetical protein
MLPGIKLFSDLYQKYFQGKLPRELNAQAFIFLDGLKGESKPMSNRCIGRISYLDPYLHRPPCHYLLILLTEQVLPYL